MNNNSDELKQRYSRIVAVHPRVDLQPIYEIDLYVTNETRSNKKKVTAREVSLSLGMVKSLVGRCLKRLVKFHYLNIAKGAKSRFFLSEEDKNGNLGKSFFSREDIEKAVEKDFGKVVEIYESNPRLLDNERKKLLRKTKSSMSSDRPNYLACEKLIDYLWSNGFNDVKKLLPRNSANRYSK